MQGDFYKYENQSATNEISRNRTVETITGPIEPRGAGQTLGWRGPHGHVPLRARIPTRVTTSISDSIPCISSRYDLSTSDPNTNQGYNGARSSAHGLVA